MLTHHSRIADPLRIRRRVCLCAEETRGRQQLALAQRPGHGHGEAGLGTAPPSMSQSTAPSSATAPIHGRKPIVARCRSSGDDGGRSSSPVGGGHSWPLWWRSPVVRVAMMVGAHRHPWWALVAHCCSFVVMVCGCLHW